jgi:hypothetical protein
MAEAEQRRFGQVKTVSRARGGHFRRIVIAGLLASVMQAQSTGGRNQGFPVVRLGVEPAALVSELLSAGEERGAVLAELGFSRDMPVRQARMVKHQLDDDVAAEAVIEIESVGSVAICVLKQKAVGWNSLGCVLAVAEFGESFAWRRVASMEWDDLVVRSGCSGGGGGYCASWVVVLHLVAGRMYEVFRLEDSTYALCFRENTQLRWVSDRGLILAETSWTPLGPPACERGRPRRSCQVYRWWPAELVFRAEGNSKVGGCRG